MRVRDRGDRNVGMQGMRDGGVEECRNGGDEG